MKGLPLKQPSSLEKMIQQLGGGPLGLAAGVGVDIQGSLDVRMPQQLLHLLGSGSGGQQVGGEGMAEHVKMKVLQPGDLLSDSPAHKLDGVRGLVRAVGAQTHQGQQLKILRGREISGK